MLYIAPKISADDPKEPAFCVGVGTFGETCRRAQVESLSRVVYPRPKSAIRTPSRAGIKPAPTSKGSSFPKNHAQRIMSPCINEVLYRFGVTSYFNALKSDRIQTKLGKVRSFPQGIGLSLTQRLRLSALNRLLISLMTWLAIVSIGLLVTPITLKPPLRKTLRAASTSS